MSADTTLMNLHKTSKSNGVSINKITDYWCPICFQLGIPGWRTLKNLLFKIYTW
jgi:hypothetical protein